MPQLEFWHFLPQFFWLAVCFIFLYVIMAFVALPRIGAVLTERRSRIEADLDAAEKARAEADQARHDYEASLALAREEARTIVAQAVQAGARTSEERLAELDRETGRDLEEARRSIDAARGEALGHLKDVAADAARLAASRLIGAEIGADEAAAAVEET